MGKPAFLVWHFRFWNANEVDSQPVETPSMAGGLALSRIVRVRLLAYVIVTYRFLFIFWPESSFLLKHQPVERFYGLLTLFLVLVNFH